MNISVLIILICTYLFEMKDGINENKIDVFKDACMYLKTRPIKPLTRRNATIPGRYLYISRYRRHFGPGS